MALKEIAYYLIILKNMSESSTEILLKLYLKYSVDKKLMESILSIHKSCAGAFIQDKIDDILKKQRKQLPKLITSEMAIAKCSLFLDCADKIKLLYLSKSFNKKVRYCIYEDILAHEKLTFENRAHIYRLIIPHRFRVILQSPRQERPMKPKISIYLKTTKILLD